MNAMPVAGLLLAAGYAQRFGGDKLLAPLPDGTPIAVAALQALRAGVDEVIAVVRPHSALAPLLAREGASLAVTEQDSGMGASIAAGVRVANANSGACLIALADMPFLLETTTMGLAEQLRLGASIVAPEYKGTRGHPVGFSRRWFNKLRLLRGDSGARELLTRYRDHVRCISMEDPGVLADIDRPADLEAYTSAPYRVAANLFT